MPKIVKKKSTKRKIKKNSFASLSKISKLHVAILVGLSLLVGGAGVLFTGNEATAACSTGAPTTAAAYEKLIRGPINGNYYRGDLGKSVKLPDGKVLWVFGDTGISPISAARSTYGINNAAFLVEKGCITALTGAPDKNDKTKKATSWIKPTSLTDVPNLPDYYWSSTPFMDGSTLYMFLSHMYNDQNGFHAIGTDLAKFYIVNGTPVLGSIVKTPGSANGDKAPNWGAAVYRDSSYTYIFGNLNKQEPWVFGHYYYLARAQNGGAISTPSKWTYWNGTAWVSNQSAAVAIVPGTTCLGSAVTINKKSNGQYVMITKECDLVGTDIVAFTASSLTGPWTKKTPALVAPVPPLNPPMSTGDYTYFGFGHPDITLKSGKQLVSWSLGSTELSAFGDLRNGVYFTEAPQP